MAHIYVGTQRVDMRFTHLCSDLDNVVRHCGGSQLMSKFAPEIYVARDLGGSCIPAREFL